MLLFQLLLLESLPWKMVKRLFFFSYNFFCWRVAKLGQCQHGCHHSPSSQQQQQQKKNQIQWNSNEIYPKNIYMYMCVCVCVCVYININWNKLRKKQKQQVGSFIRTDGWPQSDSGTRHVASSSVRPGHRPPWPALARLGPPSPVLARPTGRVLGRRPSIARHPRGIVRSRPYISLIIIIIIIILYMYLILQLIFHFSGMKNKKISWDELYIWPSSPTAPPQLLPPPPGLVVDNWIGTRLRQSHLVSKAGN